jgi:hypothetical protein
MSCSSFVCFCRADVPGLDFRVDVPGLSAASNAAQHVSNCFLAPRPRIFLAKPGHPS